MPFYPDSRLALYRNDAQLADSADAVSKFRSDTRKFNLYNTTGVGDSAVGVPFALLSSKRTVSGESTGLWHQAGTRADNESGTLYYAGQLVEIDSDLAGFSEPPLIRIVADYTYFVTASTAIVHPLFYLVAAKNEGSSTGALSGSVRHWYFPLTLAATGGGKHVSLNLSTALNDVPSGTNVYAGLILLMRPRPTEANSPGTLDDLHWDIFGSHSVSLEAYSRPLFDPVR